ncbi:MAG: GNAT family N-acetyltransferase [Anaerolineae bacterium]
MLNQQTQLFQNTVSTTSWQVESESNINGLHLEELSLNALPALQTCYYDGWIMRFADGYTKRANSVNPLYDTRLDVAEKVAYCESMYAVRKQPTVFKMTPFSQPGSLDEYLARHDYRKETGASVQVVDLDNLARAEGGARVTLSTSASEVWLSSYFRLNNLQERYLPTMRTILNNVAPQKCLAAVFEDGTIAAQGLAVLDQNYLGLFDIVTEPNLRQRGFGYQLLLYLLNWGKANGAEYAYLQVMPNNEPALRLYEKLGFNEVYQYWYRVRW